VANRYHTNNPDRKITAPAPPKDKRGKGNHSYPVKTHAWIKDIGPVGERRNKVKFPEVKVYAAQKMSDDF